MKRILLFAAVFCSALAAASETLTMKESGYDAERKVVARLMHTYFCGSHGCTLVILSM